MILALQGSFHCSKQTRTMTGHKYSSPTAQCKRSQQKQKLGWYLLFFFIFTRYFHISLKNGGWAGGLITLWRWKCQHTLDADDCLWWSAGKTSGDVQLSGLWSGCYEHSLEFSSQLCHVHVAVEVRNAALSIARGHRERIMSSFSSESWAFVFLEIIEWRKSNDEGRKKNCQYTVHACMFISTHRHTLTCTHAHTHTRTE